MTFAFNIFVIYLLAFASTLPTYGYSFEEITYNKWKLRLIDLGGGKGIRDIWTVYYPEVHGIIYVIDGTDYERLNESLSALKFCMAHDYIKGKPFLMFGKSSLFIYLLLNCPPF